MAKRTRASKRALGIGIIGTGLMGTVHAESYARLKGCAPVAYCDPDLGKAEALAKRLGGTAHGSVEALLSEPAVDAVVISSPQTAHAEHILAAARAGKHIFCEKPLALTEPELERCEKAVREAGIVFATGHQLRFHPVANAVKAAMPKLGTRFHLELEWTYLLKDTGGRVWQNYRQGGFFMELGCHLADLARYLFGEVQDVTGRTLRLNPGRVTEDHTCCLLKFTDGAVGSLLVSANFRTKRQGLLQGRIIGEKGRIEFTIYPYSRAFNQAKMILDRGQKTFVADVEARPIKVPERRPGSGLLRGFFDVYEREAEAFVKAVREGTQPPCTFADGRRAVEIVLATYHAQGLATRKPNFTAPPRRYLSNAQCHPLLARPAEG